MFKTKKLIDAFEKILASKDEYIYELIQSYFSLKLDCSNKQSYIETLEVDLDYYKSNFNALIIENEKLKKDKETLIYKYNRKSKALHKKSKNERRNNKYDDLYFS